MDLDEYDILILKELEKDGRKPYSEISKKLEISNTMVNQRVNRMKEAGLIKKMALELDERKMGYEWSAFTGIILKEDSNSEHIIELLKEIPEVVECYSISGEFDFMMKIVTEDMNSYYNFHVNKLSQEENIGQVQSVFIMGVVKQTHALV